MEGSTVPFYPLTRGIAAIREQLDSSIAGVLESGVFIGGEHVASFERNFAKSCGASYCVGNGNGLDALEMALAACDIGAGDQVIVPGFTFAATILAVVRRGAQPVVVDIDPCTANIACEAAIEAITPRTKAIIGVHLHGFQAPMRELREIADAYGLFVIEDAAQAHGSRRDTKQVGHWAHVAAYSFYPSKNLGALGDAGCITTNSQEIALKARAFGNYGNLSDKYSHDVIGFNTRLDSIQAAALSVGLTRLEESNRTRVELAQTYLREFGQLNQLKVLPYHRESAGGVWHHFIVRSKDRDHCRAFLRSRGIMTEMHYPIAAYRLPAFELTMSQGQIPVLPNADELANETLSLPMHPWMFQREVDQVIAAVLEWENLTTHKECAS